MTTNARPRTDVVRQIERSDQAAWNLGTPLTAEAAGIEPGRTSVMIGHTGGDPAIETTLTLPGGTTLQVPATGIAIQISSAPPAERTPNNMVLNENAASLEAARDRLLAVAAGLGLDETLIRQWYRDAKAIEGSPSLDAVAARFLPGEKRDYLRVGVEARYNPPTAPVLNWQLDWD